jgi:hypothetical protein
VAERYLRGACALQDHHRYDCLPVAGGQHMAPGSGFQGFTCDIVCIRLLHKKPKGGVLTAVRKAENWAFARVRVQIEHALSGVKRCRLVKDTIRLWKIVICCGP